jgi:SAM-dependent methyltransferase
MSAGVSAGFDELVDEAVRVPIVGWDFSWLEGRATEERPSWRYAEQVAARARRATRVLDVECGGAELLARLPVLPPLLVATEAYAPNIPVAAARLRPRGAHVVASGDRATLPFAAASFDLVTSRHPVSTWWAEIARVLAPGGTYFSQQVGPHSVRELSEALIGPLPAGSSRDPQTARLAAEAAGLEVRDLQTARLRTVFDDVGAIVYFLRTVVWIVPGFTVDAYRDRLLALHERIQRQGPFVAHATRFLIEVHKPGLVSVRR